MNLQSALSSLRLLGLVAFFATMPIYSPNMAFYDCRCCRFFYSLNFAP